MLAAELLLVEGFLTWDLWLCYVCGFAMCVHSGHCTNTGLMETPNHSQCGARGAARGLCLENSRLVQAHHDMGSASQVPPHDMVAHLWLQHLCPITLVRILGRGVAAEQLSALHCTGARCLEGAFAPAQPDSHPFCLQGKSRPAGCTVNFPTPPDVPPSHTEQEIGPGGKEAGMALMHVQSCPGVSRCDSGMSPHSPAQVTLAGGKAQVRPALCY